MSDALSVFERFARKAKNYGTPDPSETRDVHPFDERNVHPDIARVAQKLFDDGHYSQATFEAFKLIDNLVQSLTGIPETGHKLMMNAFNEVSPKIQLNDLQTLSDKDEQLGFRFVFAGSMSAIRNPRGHDNNRPDPIDLCLDHLSFASVLLRTLEGRKLP